MAAAAAISHRAPTAPEYNDGSCGSSHDSYNVVESVPIFSNFSFPNKLINSPYTSPQHALDLTTLPDTARLFALALTTLAPIREDYATAPYLDSLNWSEVFRSLRTLIKEAGIEWRDQEFYVVIFRSTLKDGADRDWLGKLDEESHREACQSGGLLKYWFGECDESRRNLATCVWRDREDARAGGQGPWHARARSSAGELYEQINFFAHRFFVGNGAERWWMQELT
ncbi:hypothetical protein EJ03DRAFT_32472 [Teratosphaeria nubilosa]|uniref:Uncharacterized protein n=1 Tax=Teratosphaeria nubilosa TaxID=161662 RepID=A0A6G1KVJ3_9PEZI|nr:hypothetical protein EJ03DRAFT_32472 [Teratosphaeria nubilosa]